MASHIVTEPPRPGDIWVLDDTWNPPGLHLSEKRRIALVLKEMSLDGILDEHDGVEIYSSDPLEPIYQSLVEGHIVDLHWTWFKIKVSP